MSNLAGYSIVYSGGLGSSPAAQTFAQLGVSACKIVSAAGGGDHAEITVEVDVSQTGMPFVPLARHAIYDGDGTLRFVGWLLQPGRSATPDRQQQTFRLEGPLSKLAEKIFKQPWNYAIKPTDYHSAVQAKTIPRVLLNRENYVAGTRVNVQGQIQEVLDYYLSLFSGNGSLSTAPIGYGDLGAIPACQPPEDEQTDAYCDAVLRRQLRWVPKVTMFWAYPNDGLVRPILQFSAYDAVAAGSIPTLGGGVALPSGLQYVAGGGVLVNLTDASLSSFTSKPRYDLLLGRVEVFYQMEQEVTDNGAVDGVRKVWATLTTDVSTAANGSDKELSYCFDLRGAGGLRDPATGLLETPQETAPLSLAAALHDPFRVLTHSVGWSTVGADVDWTTVPGMAVGVVGAGDALLAGSRAVIQTITRDIGTGTTSYQAGPPASLGVSDIRAMTRFNKTRGAAKNGGGSGGGDYNKKGGPQQQVKGYSAPKDTGGGGGSAPVLNDFALYDASDQAGLKVGVRGGSVSDALGNSTFAGKQAFPASAAGTVYLTVNYDASGDGGGVTGCSVAAAPSTPTTSPNGAAYLTLGTYGVTGGKVVITSGALGLGSQGFLSCGAQIFFWGL